MSNPVKKSISEAGELMKVPSDPFEITLTNEEDEVTGVFQKWRDEAWIYADSDSLIDLN